jgi:hypothetical protein
MFGLDLIQQVNLVLDLIDAPDRSGQAPFSIS